MLAFARHYQPAVVAFEDLDHEQRDWDKFALNKLMTSIDGVESKSSQVLIIMTTNHLDKIAAGLQRPGRIDKVVHFDVFSADDIKELLQKIIPTTFLDEHIDWSVVAQSCTDYAPVFVAEVGISAKLMAISEAGKDGPRVTQEMLLEVSNDLRAQHKACNVKEGAGFNK